MKIENPFDPWEARIIHQGDQNTPIEILLLKGETIKMTPQKMLGWISRERFRAEIGRYTGALSLLAGFGLFGWEGLSYLFRGEADASRWGWISTLCGGGGILSQRSNELRNKVLTVKEALNNR